MKLLRFGEPGIEKPGCLDTQGHLRDLSSILPDLTGKALSPDKLRQLCNLDLESLPLVPGHPRIGPCLQDVGKFIGIGLNYADHAKETGMDIPIEPVVFLKATSSISGPYDQIVLPHHSTHTDWEVELGVVVNQQVKHVSEQEALNTIAGYLLINDVSERHYQKINTTQWAKGKSCDTFGPIGPWLVTADEIPDPQHLDMWLEVDGKRYQNGNTENMIFTVAYLISYLSRFFTLYPGDIISTGTPAGVGFAQKPQPVYLKPGQQVRLGIAGLGEQQHLVVEEQLEKQIG